MFSRDELDRLRQWFNCVEDASPAYLDAGDRDLVAKIKALLAAATDQQGSTGK